MHCILFGKKWKEKTRGRHRRNEGTDLMDSFVTVLLIQLRHFAQNTVSVKQCLERRTDSIEMTQLMDSIFTKFIDICPQVSNFFMNVNNKTLHLEYARQWGVRVLITICLNIICFHVTLYTHIIIVVIFEFE